MTSANEYIGVGLYTMRDASRLLKLPINTLRYWAGERGDEAEAMIHRRFSRDHLLTFAELMELQFVKLFRESKVSLQAIRKTAIAASKKFNAAYPFTVKQFNTDGHTIFATLRSTETDQELVEDLQHGQLVFRQVIKPFFKRLEYRGFDAERFWPLQKRGRVVLDPARRFGQPIDSETGVPVQTIISALKAGHGQDAPKVAQWLDIPLEAVAAAVQFEKSLAS